MKLPCADQAVIEPTKLHGYVLSTDHPVGRFKARFFEGLGYSVQAWARFEADLLSQHLAKEADELESTRYGQKYEIRAILRGPTGEANVVSVWVVRRGEHPAIRDRVPRRAAMTFHPLDVVVLDADLPKHGLRPGDLGTVVEIYEPTALEVEFVTASGRTTALVSLPASDVRAVRDDDLVAVRPVSGAA